MTGTTKRRGVIALLAVVAVLGVTTNALAGTDSRKQTVDLVEVEKFADGGVLKANPAVGRAKPKAEQTTAEVAEVLGLCHESCRLAPRGSRYATPPNGNPALIEAIGESSVQLSAPRWCVACAPCNVDYRNNNSVVSWYGWNPYNAEVVRQVDTWDTDYVGFTISIASPPSGSQYFGNGQQKWETSVNNTWRTTHSWSSIRMSVPCGMSRITGVNFNISGDFMFGGQFYGIPAFAGSGVY